MLNELSYVTSSIASNYDDGGSDPFAIDTDILSNFTAMVVNDTDNQYLYDPCDPIVFNKNFNCSREKYLLFTRGPQMLQLPLVLSVSVDFWIESGEQLAIKSYLLCNALI